VAEEFLKLGYQARSAILRKCEADLGRSAWILEKDIWVCWALRTLFCMPNAPTMAFKGGTSLSKVYGAIDRFSEDVDVTIDYKSLDPDFDPFDPQLSKTKLRAHCDGLKGKVIEKVGGAFADFFARCMWRETDAGGDIEVGEDGESLRIHYQSALDGAANGYMKPSILVEFGGRNTTQPLELHTVQPYVVGHTVDLFFPTSEIPVLAGERTFWEKVTLIHVECRRDDFQARVERKSRHWYDLARLADHEIGGNALRDRALLADVVRHKKVFFASAQAHYDGCLSGGLVLVPKNSNLDALRKDYEAMRAGGMFEGEPMAFAVMIDRLSTLQRQINGSAPRAAS
jgi:hypothetical protein